MRYAIIRRLRSGFARVSRGADPAKCAADLLKLEGNDRSLVGATLILEGEHGRSTYTIGLADDGETLVAEEDHA